MPIKEVNMLKRRFFLTLLIIVGIGLFAGCQKNKNNGNEDEKHEKPTLLFLIDEGIKGGELIAYYANDPEGLYRALDNIFNATKPLKEKYDVAFLIYAHYYYRERGYNTSTPHEGLSRIHPALLTALDYFKEKGEKLYIEAYSSGVYTNQNGELGNLPLVPIYYGDTEKIKGFTMDVDAIRALRETYPETFVGVRFHELVGSDDAQNTILPGYNTPHGFPVSLDAIKAVVDVCEVTGLKLVWGDHSFDKLYTKSNGNEWLNTIKYARDKLGKNLIINSSNNSWDTIKSLELRPFLLSEDYEGASIGFSIQSWFWQEADVSSIDIINKPKWYSFAYMDMPVELMAAFTLQGIKNGAVLIQYEPAQYFFNFLTHGSNANYTGYYEKAPDYSPRLSLLRLIDLLLTEDLSLMPSMNPQDYYTSSEGKFDKNDEFDPPKKYFQATLGVIGATNTYYDVYNYDINKVFTSSNHRFGSWLFSDDIFDIERINLTFSQTDELLILTKSTSGLRGDIYTNYSTHILSDTSIFANNEHGEVIDIVTGNFIQEYVNGAEGDPDEIIIARKKNNTVTLTLYKAVTEGNQPFYNIKFYEVSNGANIISNFLGSYQFAAENYYKLTSFRQRNALYPDCTRTLDSLVLLSNKPNISAINGTILDITTIDFNLDMTDDMAILYQEDGKVNIIVYTYDTKTQSIGTMITKIITENEDVSKLLSMQRGTYYNRSIFLP